MFPKKKELPEFNHEALDVLDAIGVSKEESMRLMERTRRILTIVPGKNFHFTKKAEELEKLIVKDPIMFRVLIIEFLIYYFHYVQGKTLSFDDIMEESSHEEK